jgi:hypothetical protein
MERVRRGSGVAAKLHPRGALYFWGTRTWTCHGRTEAPRRPFLLFPGGSGACTCPPVVSPANGRLSGAFSLVFFSPPLPFSVDELMRRVRLGENGWGRQQLGWLSLALSDRRRRACIFRGGRLPPSLVSAQVADPQPQACARPAHPLPVRESTPAAAATFARPPCTSSLLPWSTRLPPRSLAGARLPRAVPRR